MIKFTLQTKTDQLAKNHISESYIVDTNTYIYDFLDKKNLIIGEISINLNGLFYTEQEAKETKINDDDILKIEYLLAEPISTAFYAFIAYLKAHAVIAFFVKLALVVAVNLALSALLKKKSSNGINNEAQSKTSKNYGITGGNNQLKPYEPLQLIIGSVRVFPDFSQNSFNDYIIDDSTPILIPSLAPFMKATVIPSLVLASATYTKVLTFTDAGTGNITTSTYSFFGPQRTYNQPNKFDQYTAPYTWVVVDEETRQPVGAGGGLISKITKVQTFERLMQSFAIAIGFSGAKGMFGNTFPTPTTPPAFIMPDWIDPNGYAGKFTTAYSTEPINFAGSAGQMMNVIQYYGAFKFENQQRLVQLFNAGFGDLNISDYRIGKIKLLNFKQAKIDRFTFKPDDANQDSGVSTYTGANYVNTANTNNYNIQNSTNAIIAAHPTYTWDGAGINPISNSYGIGYLNFGLPPDQNAPTIAEQQGLFNHLHNGVTKLGAYPTKIEILNGASLSRTKDFNGNDTDPQQSWIIREGGSYVYTIEINFSGRLMRLNDTNGKIEAYAIGVEIYFREKVAGLTQQLPYGNGWQLLDNITLSNNDSDLFTKTYYKQLPNVYKNIELAVRKITPDANNSNINEEINIDNINLFNQQLIKYPAQNRIALQIQASEQISGSIDRLSVLIEAKTWVLQSSGGDTQFLPAVYGRGWAWQTTRNPAWWYLYIVLGGYFNENTPINHPLYRDGWFLGYHANNKSQIFGVGVTNDLIDFERLADWATYCDEKELYIDLELDGTQEPYKILTEIASIGRASYHLRNGKISVVFHRADDPVTAIFGMSNIKAKTFTLSYDNKVNADEYVMTYIDRDNDFQPASTRSNVPLVTNPLNTASINLYGVTNTSQAIRECRLAAASEFYHKEILEFETGTESLVLERGDVIKVAHDLTKWADSGRITAFIIDTGIVKFIDVSCTLSEPINTAYNMAVKTPRGELLTFNTIITSNNRLQIITNWNSNAASYYLDNNYTLNTNSGYFESIPEDFIFLGSPKADVGSRYRITAINPLQNYEAKITAIRDIAEYYAAEYGLEGIVSIPDEPNVTVAYIDNMTLLNNNQIFWENINCLGATLQIAATYNSITTNATIDIDSDYINVGYASGTQLSIVAIPRNISVIYLQQSKTFTFTVA
ncbi:MAG TPA: phage tail protein [Bacteroidia bacterium]|nr:phage tail protein [Bacteroidia bacterium]